MRSWVVVTDKKPLLNEVFFITKKIIATFIAMIWQLLNMKGLVLQLR